MNKKQLENEVRRLSSTEDWNHYFELPHGIRTRSEHINSPGYCLNKWARIKPTLEDINVNDKSVLDLGCSDGYFSFESSKIGAKHVLGIDLDPLRIKRAKFIKDVHNVKNVHFETMSVYELPIQKTYDLTLCLGLLHRIPDMESCLDKLSEITNTVVSEFKTLDGDKSIKKFHGETKLNKYNTLYYTPTKKYVIEYMEKIGFTKNKIIEDVQSELKYRRTILVSSK